LVPRCHQREPAIGSSVDVALTRHTMSSTGHSMMPASLAATRCALPWRSAPHPRSPTRRYITRLYELGVMMILIPFLKTRGWSGERLGIHPTVRDSMWGVALVVGYYAVAMVLITSVASLWPQAVLVASRIHLAQGPFDWPTIITTSVVNPAFEEVFVCGYIITALKERFGTTTAINVSAGIRVFYHFYQGALGALGITPMALLFGYWFARTGRLWPLIVAHALQDFTALVIDSGG
jgi:uncharacterized protein